jgi:hypothetical protein
MKKNTNEEYPSYRYDKDGNRIPDYYSSKGGCAETTGMLFVAIIAIIVGFCMSSCTDEWHESITQVSNVTDLTIEGSKDTTIINLGDVIVDPSDITINEGGVTVHEGDITVNIAPPALTFHYEFVNNDNSIDSSKVIVNIGGSSLQTGDIIISNTNDNYLSSRDTTVTNLNVTNVNNANLTTGVTVNTDNTLTIESNVEQESCPYVPDKCIIRNCKYHHCSEYTKNHPKHKC